MSNPQQKLAQLSMKEIKQRRMKRNDNATVATVGKRKSPVEIKKMEHTSLQLQCVKLGTQIMALTPGTKTFHAQISVLMKMYDDKKSHEFLKQSDTTYDTRFQTILLKPKPPPNALTALEVEATLGTLFAYRRIITNFGFTKMYDYNAPISKPSQELHIDICVLLPRAYAESFNAYIQMVSMPPTMPNMLAKVSTYCKAPLRKLKAKWKESLDKHVKFIFENENHIAALQLIHRADAPISAEGLVRALAIVTEFQDNAALKASSPAFPFNCVDRPDGHPYGAYHDDNEPLQVAIENCSYALLVSLGKYCLTNANCVTYPYATFQTFIDKWYQAIVKKVPTPGIFDSSKHTLKLKQSELMENLWSHFVWEQSGGNYKHSTAADLEEGKPDRSIYMSPGTLRFTMMFLFEVIQEAFVHPSRSKNFGWPDGGAEKLMVDLLSQNVNDDHVFEFIPFETAQPNVDGGPLKNIVYKNVAFSCPDIRAMDMHTNPDKVDDAHRRAEIALAVSHPKNFAELLIRCLIHLSSAVIKKPLILSNQGIFFFLNHTLPSGAWATYYINQCGSAAMHDDLLEVGRNLKHTSGFIGAGQKAHGDDQILMWTWKDSPFQTNAQIAEASGKSLVTQNAKTLEECKADLQERLRNVAIAHGYEFKKETLAVTNNLSSLAYLGCHIYQNEDGIMIPSRRASQILCTLALPKKVSVKNEDPAAIAAARIMSTYYESAIPHPAIAKICEVSYQRFLQRSVKRKLSVAIEGFWTEYETKLAGSLPDYLPTRAEIFTWLTGENATSSVSGGDSTEFKDVELSEDEQEITVDAGQIEGDFADVDLSGPSAKPKKAVPKVPEKPKNKTPAASKKEKWVPKTPTPTPPPVPAPKEAEPLFTPMTDETKAAYVGLKEKFPLVFQSLVEELYSFDFETRSFWELTDLFNRLNIAGGAPEVAIFQNKFADAIENLSDRDFKDDSSYDGYDGGDHS